MGSLYYIVSYIYGSNISAHNVVVYVWTGYLFLVSTFLPASTTRLNRFRSSVFDICHVFTNISRERPRSRSSESPRGRRSGTEVTQLLRRLQEHRNGKREISL